MNSSRLNNLTYVILEINYPPPLMLNNMLTTICHAGGDLEGVEGVGE